MKKCLVTKLKDSVENSSNLLKVGELIVPITFLTEDSYLRVSFTKDSTITCDTPFKIGKSGEQTNSHTTTSFVDIYGTTLNKEVKLKIVSKYYLREFIANNVKLGEVDCTGYIKPNIFNVSNTGIKLPLSYFNNNVGDSGTISIQADNCNINGELRDFKSMDCYIFSCDNNNITGNLSDLDLIDNSSLKRIDLSNQNINGDISILARFPNLDSLNLEGCNVTGNVSISESLTKLKAGYFNDLPNLYGDLAHTLFDVVRASNGGTFSFSSNRANNKFLALENVKLQTGNDIDNLLKFDASVKSTLINYKTISISSVEERSSASDSALAELQAAGVTVSISKI